MKSPERDQLRNICKLRALAVHGFDFFGAICKHFLPHSNEMHVYRELPWKQSGFCQRKLDSSDNIPF